MRKLTSVPRSLDATSESPGDSASVHLGRIVDMDDDANITVSSRQLGRRKVRARLAVKTSTAKLRQAIDTAQQVVLVFENDDLKRPIVIGFIEAAYVESPKPEVMEADVDGKRIKIAGKDEIVLECGQASITLRRNGRIVIRGTHVETCSEGTNRIKGGQVRIN